MKINRKFTKNGNDIYENINFEFRTSKITDSDGSVIFEMNNVEVPSFWSQVATDILAQKYLRKKGVPQKDEEGNIKKDSEGNPILGSENSIKQIAYRLAGTWRHWGEKFGYFDTEDDAQAFQEEVQWMIVNQMAVPNSPQWFNTGLAWAYGIKGNAQGHFYVDPKTGKVKKSKDAYTHPQPHACFIQNIEDDLVNEGGIFDLILKEARLFKYGSGTGTNFSKIRGKGEKLSGGGESSGLMSFLKVLDAGAGSIKSGGTTRRAAKMVILDVDHPEIETFIEWKVKEEYKVASLVAGSHINHHCLNNIVKSASENGIDPDQNPELKKYIKEAKDKFVPLNYIKKVLMLVENGMKPEDFTFDKYNTDFRSEAYSTVDGQNSNNSVRVTNDFMQAVEEDKKWNLIKRTNNKVYKSINAQELWNKIVYSAWASADPGLQFHTTVNDWHTCPKDGEIRASNPCSEYMFLDETACNLYQINLGKFYNEEDGEFDIEKFRHTVRLSTIILEISVLMSQLPSKSMAEKTYKYRTLGLGFSNLGSLLMRMGYPYDSKEGFGTTGAISAIMTGEAYATSAEMAKILGTFERYKKNKEDMLRVIRNHRRAAYNVDTTEYEQLHILPKGLDKEYVSEDMYYKAQEAWDYALMLGEKYGYRNAQVSCLAPTGTTGLVMDCDTTGLEPDFALVKFKKLVGGGYFKIMNQSIKPALKKLGYSQEQIKKIIEYAVGTQTFEGAPHINSKTLKSKGFTDEIIEKIEKLLPTVFEIKYAFNKWSLGEDFCKNELNISDEKFQDPEFNILEYLGFTEKQIKEADEIICGIMTLEGAPHLKDEHLPVFDCANKCGKKGTRFIATKGHINQMAAAQPFLSGAISKTINMPEEAKLEEVDDALTKSWKSMLKANALYRDSSKLSQPLNTNADPNSIYAELFSFDDMDFTAEKKVTPEKAHEKIKQISQHPQRKKLPDERHSITHKFAIAGHKGYLTVGLYEDGMPGEIFIRMNKQGSIISGIMDAWATSVSFSLQYGVPLEEIIRKLVFMRFEPAGRTQNSEIPVAQSIMDYIGRWLALRFLEKEKAKKYHNEMLVEKSYEEGTNNRILIPFINGKGHTEIKSDQIEQLVEQEIKKGLMKSKQRKKNNLEQIEMEITETDTEVSTTSRNETHTQKTKSVMVDIEMTKVQQQLALKKNNEDAPVCAECGSITLRNGSCYKCPNCGATTGCS
ncbi:adenosylcobalamin-dependent ribonucleoside-diphosphate reductase [Candidatus Dojkabacteria bacterium]|nr:adenosylcobalamin-dependent ribonucleoside-diphosphate reductase [Candidatus Dojkabacteria bacterium]